MRQRTGTVGLVLLVWLGSLLAARAGGAEDARPTSIEELDKLPVGLKVVHAPNPALATENKDVGRRGKYTWWFKTTITSTDLDVKIVEFGGYGWVEGKWVLGNFTGKPFSSQEFAEWYSCPDALVKKGKSFADPTNWVGALELSAGKGRWYYIGVDGTGRRVKGEGVIEQKGEIDPKRPKDLK